MLFLCTPQVGRGGTVQHKLKPWQMEVSGQFHAPAIILWQRALRIH